MVGAQTSDATGGGVLDVEECLAGRHFLKTRQGKHLKGQGMGLEQQRMQGGKVVCLRR
ncbi:hypothetical protein [Pseudomonas sp. TH31]|uniref:hypothetical protein n=1 Tax=Pseudomonas sp. TH31 TaxID=2796396 RepID=UPI001913D2DF|nr:hypothetical protein [Pseudomonas sp. TH31]